MLEAELRWLSEISVSEQVKCFFTKFETQKCPWESFMLRFDQNLAMLRLLIGKYTKITMKQPLVELEVETCCIYNI